MTRKLDFVAQYILSATLVVEVTDHGTDVLRKTQTISPNHGGRPGNHTVSHWRKFNESTLTPEEESLFDYLLEQECSIGLPHREYTHQVDDISHSLKHHEGHWVYHTQLPNRGLERVVIARDLDTLKGNRYGAAILLKAFGL